MAAKNATLDYSKIIFYPGQLHTIDQKWFNTDNTDYNAPICNTPMTWNPFIKLATFSKFFSSMHFDQFFEKVITKFHIFIIFITFFPLVPII